MNGGITSLCGYLPPRIAAALFAVPERITSRTDELRLRKNAATSLSVGKKNYVFSADGRQCAPDAAIKATESEISYCLERLTGGSLYACEESVIRGFIPLADGARAGLCGRAAVSGGKVTGFAEISSIDLRIHRFIRDLAAPLINYYAENGVCGAIVISPPCGGKTTFLRSLAFLAANGKGLDPIRVAVADEREEIACAMPKGGLLDVLSAAPKAEAITVLTRSLAPQMLICDEISGAECEELLDCVNCGTAAVASAHGTRLEDLLARPGMKKLISSGAFGVCVTLDRDRAPEVTPL